jgi:hypothetical protein
MLFVDLPRQLLELLHRFFSRAALREPREGEREKIYGRTEFVREPLAEPRLGLGKRENRGDFPIDQQSPQQQHAGFRRGTDTKELLIVARLASHVSELPSGRNGAPRGGRQVVDSDLQLRGLGAIEGGRDPFRQHFTTGIIHEQHDAGVAIVFGHVVRQRTQCIGDIGRRREYS